jgi:hypothetical protein
MQSFPLLALSLLVYAVLSLFAGDAKVPWYELEAVRVRLMSGDLWSISVGHLFITCSMALLFVELLRATQSGSASVTNHALSVLVFIAALLMFLTLRGYGNSTFFVYVSMTFMDFMAGFIITTVTSRRDLAFGRAD